MLCGYYSNNTYCKSKRTDESVEEQAKDLARSTETHKSEKLKIFPCHETIK